MQRKISSSAFVLVLTIFLNGCGHKTIDKAKTTYVQSGTSDILNDGHISKKNDTDINDGKDIFDSVDILDDIDISDDTVSFIDAIDDRVTIRKRPERVVCLYDSYLELWDLAGGKVIGRVESKRTVPEPSKDAEVIGKTGAASIEKIIALEPDLVILSPTMNGQNNLIDMLKQNKISYIAIKYQNVMEYLKVLKIFTELTGRNDLYIKNGVEVVNRVKEIVFKVAESNRIINGDGAEVNGTVNNELENNSNERKTIKILLLFATSRGITVKLPNSSVGSMLEDLGTMNIASGLAGGFGVLDAETQIFSLEKIIEENPDFIFVESMGGTVQETKNMIDTELGKNNAWNSLDAVRNCRLIYLEKELYTYKPNTRYPEAYEKLARTLYPEVFR